MSREHDVIRVTRQGLPVFLLWYSLPGSRRTRHLIPRGSRTSTRPVESANAAAWASRPR
jgi:hypothetical protein